MMSNAGLFPLRLRRSFRHFPELRRKNTAENPEPVDRIPRAWYFLLNLRKGDC